MYENTTRPTDQITAMLKGSRNIYQHIEYLFKNAKKDIIYLIKNEDGGYTKKPNVAENKAKNLTIKTRELEFRLCVVDDNSVIFPVKGGETHPDYDFCIWIKNKEMAGFFKHLMSSA